MFVRWKRRKLVFGELLCPALVRCVRGDGKPRQKFIAYLGSFNTGKGYRSALSTESIVYINNFYLSLKVDENLLALGTEIGEDRTKIEASIIAVVPRPTEDEKA